MPTPTRQSIHKTKTFHPDTEQQQQHQNKRIEHQHHSAHSEETTAIQNQLQEDHPTHSRPSATLLERETPNQTHAIISAQRQRRPRSSSNMTPIPVLVPDSAGESEDELERENIGRPALGQVARLSLDLQCIVLNSTTRHQHATINRIMSVNAGVAEVLFFILMTLC